jgi:hypothetical protein
MISGDHNHADTCAVRLGDRNSGFLSRRIDDPDGADEDQVLFQGFVRAWLFAWA